MSVFSTAATAARDHFYTLGGESVTYSRSGQSDLTVTAVLSENRDELVIKAASIDFGSGAVAPARGDKITDAGGTIYRYPGPESANVDGVPVVVKADYLRDSAEYSIPLSEET